MKKLLAIFTGVLLLLTMLPIGTVAVSAAAPSSYTTIAAGETKTVNITYGGENEYFRFVPTVSGSHTFKSSGVYDTYGYLLDSFGEQLHSDDDSGGNRDFSITYNVTAGNVYYLQTRMYSSSTTGSYEVSVVCNVPTPVTIVGGTQAYSLFNSGATSSSGYEYSSSSGADYNPDSHSYNNNGYDIYGDSPSYTDLTLGLGLSFYVSTTVTERATLTIYAYDIDEESDQIDDIYLVNDATGVRTKIGNLVGRDESWSTTTLTIDPSYFEVGHTYHFEVDVCYGGWWTWVRRVSLEVTGGGSYVPTTIVDSGFSATIDSNGQVNTDLYLKTNESVTYDLEFTAEIGGEQKGGEEWYGFDVGTSGNSLSSAFSLESGAPTGVYTIRVIVKDTAGNTVATYTCTAGYAYSAVSYHANGGSQNLPLDTTAYGFGDTVTVLFDALPSRYGYTFLGWATDAYATTPEFTATGNTAFVIGDEDVTLYAVWRWTGTAPNYGDVWDGSVSNAFGGGSGTQTDPYLIYTAEQLAYLAQSVNGGNDYSGKYFKLMNNLDLNNLEWTPIGKNLSYDFAGHFDGNYHTIYHLRVTGNKEVAGLFGFVKSGSIIALGVADGYVSTRYDLDPVYAGLLVGAMDHVTLTACFATGSVYTASAKATSGYAVFVGLLSGGVENSNSSATATVSNCYAVGDVCGEMLSAWNVYAGGLLGNGSEALVNNCYFSGSVVSKGMEDSLAGGICGVGDIMAQNSFAVGSLTAPQGVPYLNYIAPVWRHSPSVSNCYYDLTLSHSPESQKAGTYVDASNFRSSSWIESHLGWDFVSVWEMGADYPVLRGFDMGSVTPTPPNTGDVWDGSVSNAFGGGSGTETDPYLIYTAEQLAYLAQSVNDGNNYSGKYFKLMNNLDLNNLEWTPIGKGALNYETALVSPYFAGNFDGNYHTIYNLKVQFGETSYNGLFGYVYGGLLTRVGIVGAYVNAYAASGHRMDNGALVGKISNGSIVSQCFATDAEVYAYSTDDPATAGVLIGNVDRGSSVSSCYAQGTVTSNASAGGLIGSCYSNSSNTVTNCYAQCTVKYEFVSTDSAGDFIGGVVGYAPIETTVSNCFFIGEFSTGGSSVMVAPIVAYEGIEYGCYYSSAFSSFNYSQGDSTDASNFRSSSWIESYLDWDFSTVWEMGVDYPVLQGFDTSSVIPTPPATGDVWDGSVSNAFGGGSGTQSDPYLIYTAEQLAYLAQSVNGGTSYSGKYFKLMNNLDLNNLEWTPIGKGILTDDTVDTSYAFNGNFNGNGHIVYNLSIVSPTTSFSGLFGHVDGGSITDLGVVNAVISGSSSSYRMNHGTLVGYARAATVSRCFATNVNVTAFSTSNPSNAAGLIGVVHGSTVSNCYAQGTMTTCASAGGLIGAVYTSTSTITDCYAVADITYESKSSLDTAKDTIAGVVGCASANITVRNCFFSGTLTVTSGDATKYAIADVSGSNFTTTVSNGYYSTTSSVASQGTSVADSDFRSQSWITSHLGWNFTDTWTFVAGQDYPVLRGFVQAPAHNHEYVGEVTIEATCGTDGVMTYTCSCGDGYTEAIPALGHVYSYTCDEYCDVCDEWRVVEHVYTDDCDEYCDLCGMWREAWHYYSYDCDEWCDVCGMSRVVEHTYSYTCDEYCDVCGEWRVVEHVYTDDCDEYCDLCGTWREAWHYYSYDCDEWCDVCGTWRTTYTDHVYDDEWDEYCDLCGEWREVYYPSCDHDYDHPCDEYCNWCGEWREVPGHAYVPYITTDRTCGSDGVLTYICSNCGDSYEEYLPATGAHTYDHGCDVYCDVCGYYRDPGDHPYIVYISVAPTCGADGELTYICDNCGDTYTEPIPATGAHTYSHPCDADCNVCGYVRSVGDHAYIVQISIDPTCNEEGVLTYTCSFCGDVYTEAIAATGAHIYDHPCDADCNVCGDVRSVGDHIYTTRITIEATCGSEGECTHTCIYCGDSYTVVIPATEAHVHDNPCDPDCNNCFGIRVPGDHAYVAGVTTEATCSGEGVRTYTCNHCGDAYTEVIPATGMHVYDHGCDTDCNHCGNTREPGEHIYVGSVTTEATCGAEGVVTYTCSACGDAYTEVIPATNMHVYDHGCDTDCNHCGNIREPGEHVYIATVTTEATCGTEGVVTYTCSACGDSYTVALPASGVHTYANVCDADCDVCGWVRPVDGHVYDHDYDGVCNVCGETRAVPELPVTAPTFAVDSIVASPGRTFTIAIRTKNNTGIVSLRLEAAYDPAVLELVSIVQGDFKDLSVSPLENNPFIVNWVDAIHPNNTTNGVVALVTFRVKEDAPVGTTDITLSYNADDVYDSEFNNVLFRVEAGTIRIAEYVPGDANGDGVVNNKDLGLLQQVINEWAVTYEPYAADTDGDGRVNNKDLGLLQRYLSGWNVQLG